MGDGRGFALYRAGDKQEAFEMRRAKKLNAIPKGMTEADFLRIKNIYRKAADLGLEVDHIIPLDLGGPHHPDNLQLLTRADNRMKSTMYASDIDTRKLLWSDKATPFDQPLVAGSKKDWVSARKQVKKNQSLMRNIGVLGSGYSKNLRASTALTDFALTGNPLSGAAALAHTSPVQKRVLRPAAETIGKQIAKLTAKRAGGTVLKTALPVVGDLAIGGAMTYGYLQQGRYNQALWEAISTGVGLFPGLGDAASATIDANQLRRDIQYIRRGIGN